MEQCYTAWNEICLQTVCQACLQTTEINLLSLNFWVSHATIILHQKSQANVRKKITM